MIKPIRFHVIVACDEFGYRSGKLASFAARLVSAGAPILVHVLCHHMPQRSAEAIGTDQRYTSVVACRGTNPLSASKLINQVSLSGGETDLIFSATLDLEFSAQFFPTLAKIVAAHPRQSAFKVELSGRISGESQTPTLSDATHTLDDERAIILVRSPMCQTKIYREALKSLPADFIGDSLFPCLAIAPTILQISGLPVTGQIPRPHRNTPWTCKLLAAALETPSRPLSMPFLASSLSGLRHIVTGRLHPSDWLYTLAKVRKVATL